MGVTISARRPAAERMGLLRHEHNRSRASIVVDEGADRHDPRAGGVVLEGQLAGAEAARRFNDVALGFQFQFKALLTGDTGALLSRHDLAMAALAWHDRDGLTFSVFHRLIEPGTIQQIVL